MSLFSDLDKMHIDLKGSIISIAVQLPFWYVSLFVFNYDLYYRADYFLLVAICIMLATISYGVLLSVEFISAFLVDRLSGDKKNTANTADMMTLAFIRFMFHYSTAFTILYIIQFFCRPYYIFFILLFALAVSAGSISRLSNIGKRYRKKEPAKATEEKKSE